MHNNFTLSGGTYSNQ